MVEMEILEMVVQEDLAEEQPVVFQDLEDQEHLVKVIQEVQQMEVHLEETHTVVVAVEEKVDLDQVVQTLEQVAQV
jgi:hypothetical protein